MSEQAGAPSYDTELRGIAVFVAIAHTTGISGAAQRLGLSKSTVSNRLRTLEEHLGVQLLERTTRTIGLTPAGKDYLARCEDILEAAQAAGRTAAAAVAAGSAMRLLSVGLVRIGLAPVFGPALLAAALVDLAEPHPDVTVDPRIFDRPAHLEADGVDVVVASGQREPGRGIRCLGPFAQVVVCAPEGRGVQAPGPLSVVLPLVRAGLGSATVPRFLVAADLAEGRLLAEEEGPPLHMHLRYEPARLTSAGAALVHHLFMCSRDIQWADEEAAAP